MKQINRKNIESICYVRTQIIRAPCKYCICNKDCNMYVEKYGCLPHKNYLGGNNNEETRNKEDN